MSGGSPPAFALVMCAPRSVRRNRRPAPSSRRRARYNRRPSPELCGYFAGAAAGPGVVGTALFSFIQCAPTFYVQDPRCVRARPVHGFPNRPRSPSPCAASYRGLFPE